MINKYYAITKYDPKIDSKKTLEKLIGDAYRVNQLFFSKDTKIKVNFIYSRAEMDQFRRYKTPDWVVGSTNGENIIGIFSPKVFDKVSSHLASDFPYVLTHEIAHIFTEQFYGFKFPMWFREGLAGYIAGQYKNRVVRKDQLKDFRVLHNYKNWENNPNYNQAFLFTNYLAGIVGKDKFLAFCTRLGLKDSYKVFCQKFKDNFGFSLDECKNKWIETLNN